jgi:hypothetical protein
MTYSSICGVFSFIHEVERKTNRRALIIKTNGFIKHEFFSKVFKNCAGLIVSDRKIKKLPPMEAALILFMNYIKQGPERA